MSVPKARMTDIHDDKQGDDDDVTLLDIVKENGQKAERMGRLMLKIFAMSEKEIKDAAVELITEVIKRESSEQQSRLKSNPFDDDENTIDSLIGGASSIKGEENFDEQQQSRIASLEEECQRLKEHLKIQETTAQAEMDAMTAQLKMAVERENELMQHIESRGGAMPVTGERSEIGLGAEIGKIRRLGEDHIQRMQDLLDVKTRGSVEDDRSEGIQSVSSPGKTTAEQMMADEEDIPKHGVAGYKRMSAAEATKFQERSAAAQHALERMHTTSQKRVTPTVRKDSEMNALLETIKKKAQEKCGGSAGKKQRVRDAVYTEVGLFIKLRDILVDSGVDRGVLIESLNQAESYPELAKLYADGYEAITGDDLDDAQKKDSNIQQRKDALQRQDDQFIIAVVENGFAPLSIMLAAACDPRVFESDRGKIQKIAQRKSELGIGLYYILAAVTNLCQASWEKMRLELEDLLSLPRVVENVANESIERMQLMLQEKVDEFEKRHGKVDSDMIRGFMLLTMIKSITSARLKESMEDLRKRQYFESTPQDLTGAVTEAKKAVSGMIEQERNHADEHVRNRVNLQPKSIANALEKMRNETQQAANMAAAKGYTSGMEASVNMILGKDIEKDTARDAMVLSILKDQNNKMAQTRAKRADELREIVSIMERIGKSVSSSAKTQVDEKDRKTLMSLGNSLDEIRGMLTGNGRKDRGRADTQPNHRNAAGGSDNSYGDQICRYWSAGNCKKGSACKFKHPDDNGGEQAQGGVKPTCATEGCDKKCGKQKNGEFYKHCYDCGKKAGSEQQKDAGFVAAPEQDIREQGMDSIFDEWAELGVPKPVPQVNERVMFHAMEYDMKPDTCSSTSALWGETQAYITNIEVDAAQIEIEKIEPDGQCMFRALSKETDLEIPEGIRTGARA